MTETKYSDNGITTIVADEKITIELPISGLVSGFNNSPNNPDEIKVKQGKEKQFADYIAKRLLSEIDQHTGDTPVTEAFEKAFEEVLDGYEYRPDIFEYPEDCEDD